MYSPQASPKNVFNYASHDKENIILVESPTGEIEGAETFDSRSSLRRRPLRPSSPANGRRPASPLANSRPRSANASKPLPSGKLELFVRCDELPKMDAFSSSDPICVLYVQRYGQWIEYGRTECIPNCHKPKVSIAWLKIFYFSARIRHFLLAF